MWYKQFEKKWYILPALSGVLLVASFNPFNIWPLGCIALTPLFYFVAAFPNRSKKEIFWGGFAAGSLFAGSICYFTVIQFHWLPQTYLFVSLVHSLFFPIAVLGGLQWGLTLLAYRALRSQSVLWSSLAGAALYTVGEMLLYALFGGYYFAMLAYLATPLVPLISFAALGGAFFVSFIIALFNVSIAEAIAAGFKRSLLLLIPLVVLLAVYAGNEWYLHKAAPLRTITVAMVQESDKGGVTFGSTKDGVFSFPQLSGILQKAGQNSPDLLIYPFSPVEGALYRGTAGGFNKNILIASEPQFGAWLEQYVATSTTVMLWNNLYESGSFYNDFEFWKGGAIVGEYRKRDLFPFLDYTPAWAAAIGLYTTSVDFTAGQTNQPLAIDGIPAGALLCSEIQQQGLARSDALHSLFIISAGSDAVFVDGVSSEYSRKAAQFRAIENYLPVIRSNLLGPSSIINSDGSIIAGLGRGQDGSVTGVIPLHEPRITLYTRWGDIPMSILLICLLGAGFWLKVRHRLH